MRLHPNPPRMVTVALALALAVVGVAFALPIDAAMPLLDPVVEPVAGAIGLALDAELGYLCLFLSSGLLVAGSLLPGI
jgi:hypothetical protein